MPIFQSALDLIFPPLCVHCQREGSWLCSSATTQLNGEQVKINPLTIEHVDLVLTRGSYDCEPLAQLIQKLKYQYWTGVSSLLHTVVEPIKNHLDISSETVIIPVPLHRRRQRERGFNQSLCISRALGTITGYPVVDLLNRTRYTPPQAQLSAQERVTNIIGAFDRQRVKKWPASVILVDDVITTGSTISACAEILRKNGVQKVTAVALAKG